MASRKGLGAGRGKGYKNIVGIDPRVHSDSAKGRKQPQKIPMILTQNIPKIPSNVNLTINQFKLISIAISLKENAQKEFDKGNYKTAYRELSDASNTLEGFEDKQVDFVWEYMNPLPKRPPEKIKCPEDFARDSDGKISKTILSEYGKKELYFLQGAQIHFDDIGMVVVKGNKMIIEDTGKLFDTIDSDLKVNKIIFRVI